MDFKKKLNELGGKAYTALTKEEVVSCGETAAEGETGEKKPSSKRRPILLLVALAAIILLALVVFKGFAPVDNRATVKIPDFITVSMSPNSRNGHGRIVTTVNKDGLAEAMRTAMNKAVTVSEVDKVIQATTITIEPSEGLRNDDVVSIDIVVDKEWAELVYPSMRLEGGSGTYTVSGLSDAEYVDPFSENLISVRVEGNSGAAVATLDMKSSAPYMPFLNYVISPERGLSNGDTVTITINPNMTKLTDMGYALPEKDGWTYTQTVSGLAELVSDPKQIPASSINSMVSYAESDLAKNFAALTLDELDQVVIEPEISSIYFFDKVDKSNPYVNYFRNLEMTNGVFVMGHFFVQDVEMVQHEEAEPPAPEVVGNYGGYYVWIFPNVVKETNGAYSYDSNMIVRWPTQYQTESDCVNWAKGEFAGFSVINIGTNEA